MSNRENCEVVAANFNWCYKTAHIVNSFVLLCDYGMIIVNILTNS